MCVLYFIVNLTILIGWGNSVVWEIAKTSNTTTLRDRPLLFLGDGGERG